MWRQTKKFANSLVAENHAMPAPASLLKETIEINKFKIIIIPIRSNNYSDNDDTNNSSCSDDNKRILSKITTVFNLISLSKKMNI